MFYMSKKKKTIESAIKEYNKRIIHDINHNDGAGIIHGQSSIYTYTNKSIKNKKCKFCNDCTCENPFSLLTTGTLCKGKKCSFYTGT